MAARAETPMMQQHREIKQRYPDAILLFRVGDFYETFGDDAVNAARILGITLTKRNNGVAGSQELAGFPHHALDTYLHKLVKAGFRVAICDQLEDPKLAKGLVKRGVTELLTPGIATNDKLLEQQQNNFLCAVHVTGDDRWGIAFTDISTGEFYAAEGDPAYIDKLIQTLRPAEVIYQRPLQKRFREFVGGKFYTYTLDPWIFDGPYAGDLLRQHFKTHSLKGFGVEDLPMAVIAAGTVIHYLKDTEHPHLQHLSTLQRIEQEQSMWLDKFTVRNLELLPVSSEGASLLQVMDQTVSPMGARLLRRWLLMPLRQLTEIDRRLNATGCLLGNQELLEGLTQSLRHCGDVERMAARIPARKINPREVLQLARSLQLANTIKEALKPCDDALLGSLGRALNACGELCQRITQTVSEQAPAQLSKGQVICEGVDEDLDSLRRLATGGKQYLVELQQREQLATGIPSLKVGFNNVFGYFLEVTNAHKDKAPADWIRKQTLANAERYITPELKDYEEKITGAEDKIAVLEAQLYESLLQELALYLEPLQANARLLASLDCLCAFAQLARSQSYCRPEVHEGSELQLTAARHPVIEQRLPPGETYVANDVALDALSQQIIILTGPNMSGKSAILRQTALITLMAHMGSYVPATEALVPLTDKIFTRVGASDNLSGGESTFMVEMNETASIVNNLSQRSLVLLDEIGRGTSTYDGISIAWSLVEYLHEHPGRPKVLFATHYHELNELEQTLPRVKNYHITNREVNGNIIFLRKLAPGGSIHSFGIHVARLAGMPPRLVERSTEILHMLEAARTQVSGEAAPAGQPKAAPTTEALTRATAPRLQLNIFDAHSQTFESMRDVLEKLDINRLTPVEALMKLNEIKGMLGN